MHFLSIFFVCAKQVEQYAVEVFKGQDYKLNIYWDCFAINVIPWIWIRCEKKMWLLHSFTFYTQTSYYLLYPLKNQILLKTYIKMNLHNKMSFWIYVERKKWNISKMLTICWKLTFKMAKIWFVHVHLLRLH